MMRVYFTVARVYGRGGTRVAAIAGLDLPSLRATVQRARSL